MACLQVGLHSRQDPQLLQAVWEQRLARARAALVQRLRIQDGSAQVRRGALCLKQHLAVCSSVLLCVLDTVLGEPVADCPWALVTGRDALSALGDMLAHLLQLRLALFRQVRPVVAAPIAAGEGRDTADARGAGQLAASGAAGALQL